MKERFKTFLLVMLVISSVVLTKELWIELPTKVFSSEKEEENKSQYNLVDMIAPNKYLIHFDENNHTLFYDESKYTLWTDAREGLKSVMESNEIEIEKINKEDFSRYNRERSISFEFPEKINIYILAKALEIEKPNRIIDAIDEITSIYIYLGAKEPFFVFSNDKENIKIKDQDLYYIEELDDEEGKWDIISKVEEKLNLKDKTRLTQEEDVFKLAKLKEKISEIEEKKKFNYYYSMKDMVGTTTDVYIPYEMNNILPTVYMENQIRKLDEESKNKIVEDFFDEKIDYIREVVESNGSNIYIHDQRVLKFNQNGTLEYFHPLDDSVKNRNLYESMRTAAGFLSNIIDLSDGMYLSNIEEIEDENENQGFLLSFKYRIRGIPVILGNLNFDDFVKMEVYNDHVKSYSQFMRKDMAKSLEISIEDKRSMLPSFDVIDKNYKIFLEDYREKNQGEELDVEKVLSSIKDITLAYFDPGLKEVDEELIGVWVIRTDVGMYSFDIFNGRLVNKKIFK